jgi:hypothetical protein
MSWFLPFGIDRFRIMMLLPVLLYYRNLSLECVDLPCVILLRSTYLFVCDFFWLWPNLSFQHRISGKQVFSHIFSSLGTANRTLLHIFTQFYAHFLNFGVATSYNSHTFLQFWGLRIVHITIWFINWAFQKGDVSQVCTVHRTFQANYWNITDSLSSTLFHLQSCL